MGTKTFPPLPAHWREVGGRLVAAYQFKDFVAAMRFLNEVADVAERQEHHPDFHVHWNEVRFEVWSHDVNSITDRDRRLVAEIAAWPRNTRPKP